MRRLQSGLAAAILAVVTTAHADVPRLVHYQGKLVTSAGAIVAGPASLRLRLYADPTAPTPLLFDETHNAVDLNRGLFSVLIGSQTGGGVPDSVLALPVVYLGIAVDGAAELSPRIRLATAPYAAKSRSAESLVRPNTATTAVTVDGSGDVSVTNRLAVGSGVLDPSAVMDVASTTGGFLMPRMTEAQRDAIAAPGIGLFVFNTTTGCVNMWTGATWKQSCFECAFTPPFAGNSGPICEGDTLNLTATDVIGAVYSWTGPNGFTSNIQNPSISDATPAASGPYSVTATLNGCTTDPVTTLATVNPIPISPTASNNGPICESQTLMLFATSIPGAVYSWTGPDGFSSILQNPTIPNATNAATGQYSVIASVNGCTSAPSNTNATVIAIPPMPGSITGASQVCMNDSSVIYSISDVPGASSYTWTVPPGASIAAGQGTAFLTADFGSNSGSIGVTANNVCGASALRTLTVTVATSPGNFSQTLNAHFNQNTNTMIAVANDAMGLQNDADYGTGLDGAYSATSNTSLAGGTYNYTTFNINSGVTVTVTGSTPLVIKCTGQATINGFLRADGSRGENGSNGCGGAHPGGAGGGGGGGAGGTGSQSCFCNGGTGQGTGGGAGGGSSGSSNGSAGSFGSQGGGSSPGPTYGSAQLDPLMAGSGGGGGGGHGNCATGGGAGGGGGSFMITAPNINIAAGGGLSANGGIGASGYTSGGGGSGGGIRLSAPLLTNNGSISATGGSGESGNNGSAGNGGDGRIRLDYNSLSGSGSITPNPGFTAAVPYVAAGTSVTQLISPANLCEWGVLTFNANTVPSGTAVTVDILNSTDNVVATNVSSGTDLSTIPAVDALSQIKLRVNLSTSNTANTPQLLDLTVTYVTF